MEKYDLRIDGDAIVYTAGFAADSRGGDLSHSLYNAKLIIQSIIDKFIPCDVTIYLTHTDPTKNFRNQIVDDYKANRKGAKKPVYYKELRRYLLDKYKAKLCMWGEADDFLCMNVSERTVIASKDKDLLQVPGLHYRIHTGMVVQAEDPGSLQLITKTDKAGRKKKIIEGNGFKWFCAQMILGDTIDNIHKPEVGFGPVQVYKILNHMTTKREMWLAIDLFYRLTGKSGILWTNGALLWMARIELDIFSPERLEEYLSNDN